MRLLLLSLLFSAALLRAMQSSSDPFLSYKLPSDQIDLQRLHDDHQYELLHDFADTMGAFVLEDYYQLGLIDQQTLLDIAALTGCLDLFYSQERMKDDDLWALRRAIQYSHGEGIRHYGSPLRQFSQSEWDDLVSSALYSTH